MTSTLLATRVMAVLEQALEAEFGLELRITVAASVDIAQPVLRARALFYRFRADLAPAYDNLQIRLHPRDPDHKLWFIKRTASLGEGEPELGEAPRLASRHDIDLL